MFPLRLPQGKARNWHTLAQLTVEMQDFISLRPSISKISALDN
jgi:hypothetical protein